MSVLFLLATCMTRCLSHRRIPKLATKESAQQKPQKLPWTLCRNEKISSGCLRQAKAGQKDANARLRRSLARKQQTIRFSANGPLVFPVPTIVPCLPLKPPVKSCPCCHRRTGLFQPMYKSTCARIGRRITFAILAPPADLSTVSTLGEAMSLKPCGRKWEIIASLFAKQ